MTYLKHIKQATAYQNEGKLTDAIGHYQEAIKAYPRAADAWLGVGMCYAAMRYFTQAIESLTQSIDLELTDKQQEYAIVYLAYCYREQGFYDIANQILDAVEKPGNNVLWAKMALFPCVNDSSMLDIRNEKYDQLVNGFRLFDYSKPFTPLFTPFYAHYQGNQDISDKMINQASYRALAPFYPKKLPFKKHGGKIRVGFISANLTRHSVGNVYARLFNTLCDDERLNVFVYATPEMGYDSVTQAIEQQVSVFRKLSGGLDTSRKTIASDGLDMLVYTDIGMDVFTWAMSFTRLADVQCVMGGHPVTTGFPTVDYFISSECLHYKDWDSQFSERVVALKHICVDYPRPPHIEHQSLEQLGLPIDKHIYTVPMTLFKVHPDMDQIIYEILTMDKKGIVLFFKFGDSQLHQVLANRFKNSIPDVTDRIFFHDWADNKTFMNILKHSDLVFDTPYFGGGNTTYLSLHAGTPVVSLRPPSSLKDASTKALYMQYDMPRCYREADLQGLLQVLRSRDMFKPWVKFLKDEVKARRDYLFEDNRGAVDFANWIVSNAKYDMKIKKRIKG